MANSIANESDLPRAEVIARLNDRLRTTGVGGVVMITQNVRRISGFDTFMLGTALADYREFDFDNDPHGERDFGYLKLWGQNLVWMIDYYDKSLKFGSPDPADPRITRRALTVMLMTEW